MGETLITVGDYTSGRIFDDAVSYAFYPVDLHTRSGVRAKPLAKDTVPTIPLSALEPKDSRNILFGCDPRSTRLAPPWTVEHIDINRQSVGFLQGVVSVCWCYCLPFDALRLLRIYDRASRIYDGVCVRRPDRRAPAGSWWPVRAHSGSSSA